MLAPSQLVLSLVHHVFLPYALCVICICCIFFTYYIPLSSCCYYSGQHSIEPAHPISPSTSSSRHSSSRYPPSNFLPTTAADWKHPERPTSLPLVSISAGLFYHETRGLRGCIHPVSLMRRVGCFQAACKLLRCRRLPQ